MSSVPRRRGRFEDTEETQDRKPGKTTNGQQPLKARRSMEGFFSKAFRENMTLLTPWFWTSILQKWEKIKFCFIKHTTIHLLVIFFITALWNEYTYLTISYVTLIEHWLIQHSSGENAFFLNVIAGFFSQANPITWRKKWQPTPVLLSGKSHGWRSLVGYSPRGLKESDTTEWLHFHFSD